MSNPSDAPGVMAMIDPDITARLVSRRSAIAKGATTSGLVMAGLRLGTVPDRKSTRLNSSHERLSRMPSSA